MLLLSVFLFKLELVRYGWIFAASKGSLQCLTEKAVQPAAPLLTNQSVSGPFLLAYQY